MIKTIAFATVWVLDQDRAKDFYVNTLGFEVQSDERLGSFRWLTVAPPGQAVAFVLMPLTPNPMMDESTVATLRGLVEKGVMGPGGLLTDDVHATYTELSKKGVKFVYPPKDQPYGIETIMRDDSGNPFSLVQRRK
ncbi:MAG TPA: VOC family protein [Terriglobales bacterium]|nr:VOC family protein [Terriglobales bacterium]